MGFDANIFESGYSFWKLFLEHSYGDMPPFLPGKVERHWQLVHMRYQLVKTLTSWNQKSSHEFTRRLGNLCEVEESVEVE